MSIKYDILKKEKPALKRSGEILLNNRIMRNKFMMVDPLLPYQIVNKIYTWNFLAYKYIYFLYKNIAERKEIGLIKKIVKPGMVVLDVGANIGFYTLLLSKLVGDRGKVYAFEPEKYNFKNLKKLCNKRKNIVLNNVAVGEMSGDIDLYISGKLNVDHRTYDNHENRRHSKIRCVSMDSYFDRNKKIGFIKIDTQGFEYRILLGMKKLLLNSKEVVLFCEILPTGLKDAGSSVNQTFNLLKKYGFKIIQLKSTSESYTNIIARRT